VAKRIPNATFALAPRPILNGNHHSATSLDCASTDGIGVVKREVKQHRRAADGGRTEQFPHRHFLGHGHDRGPDPNGGMNNDTDTARVDLALDQLGTERRAVEGDRVVDALDH